MQLFFSKYQATGNDFILIDNRTNSFDKEKYELVSSLCHRRFGIGADGLILLEASKNYDFFMRYYNADGYEASMCGNGGRAIVHFAKTLGLIQDKAIFMAPDGVHSAHFTEKGIALQMQNISDIEQIGEDFFMNTGSPHYVKIVPSLENWDTVNEGRKIRCSKRFVEDGTNVNFLSINSNNLQMTTYERGVEDETYSCGTGAVATAIVAGIKNGKTKQELHTKGGILSVQYKKELNTYRNITLEGAVTKVFEGNLNL